MRHSLLSLLLLAVAAPALAQSAPWLSSGRFPRKRPCRPPRQPR